MQRLTTLHKWRMFLKPFSYSGSIGNLLILIYGYANEPETKDPHRSILKTITSQNHAADFPNSFFHFVLDPQTFADGVSFSH